MLFCPIHIRIQVVLGLFRVVIDGEECREEEASKESHWKVQVEESIPAVKDAWKQEEGNNVNGFTTNEDRSINTVQWLKSNILVSFLDEVHDISDQITDADERIEHWAINVLVAVVPMSLQLWIHTQDGELRERVCVL